jgi:hypothetical protein
MADTESAVWETPTIEVRVYRDGSLVQRELCESAVEAAAVVDSWSEVEGVICQVDDTSSGSVPAGVLDPRRWEVDADESFYEGPDADDEEER